MATEKKDNVAEEAEDIKNEKPDPKETDTQTEQKMSEPAPEKATEEKAAEEKAAEEKPEASTEEKQEKVESQKVEAKPESPDTDPGESEPEESAKRDFLSEIRKDLPDLKPGDIIRVYYRVIEGGKERIQAYEGTVIAMKNSGVSKTVTVRKTSFGIAVERIFPLNSKLIQKIEVKKHSKVRRAKLYYLRKLKGKAARLKELR